MRSNYNLLIVIYLLLIVAALLGWDILRLIQGHPEPLIAFGVGFVIVAPIFVLSHLRDRSKS